MKTITAIVLLGLISTYAIGQESQDSLRQKTVESIQEKFPETRFFNLEYNQSMDRRFSSELYGQGFQEGNIKSQQNFIASANIPMYATEKWSFTASMFYQRSEYEFDNIENASPSAFFERNGMVNYHSFSVALNSTYFSVLFNKPVIFNASIIADANEESFGRMKGILGFTFIMTQTERTTVTLGAMGFIDPSSQIPFIPTFSYGHSFKNSKWELDFILPQRLLFRRPVGENGRMSLGSSIAFSEFYVNENNQTFGNTLIYNQIELRTGISYEHRINDYLIATFQGGVQNFINNRSTEKGESARDFIHENKQDATGYFQIGISIDPFAKRNN